MITPNTVHSWTCEPSSIDVARILRVHKYRDVSKVRPVIVKAAEVASSRAETLAQPDARYVYLPIESFENHLLKVFGDIEFKSEAFHQYLGGCDHLLAFVMTIGAELDETVIGLVENVFEPLDALFLETVGWLTIERATRQFAQYLKGQFSEQGWEVSLRLGPGYEYPNPSGDGRVSWDLWQQQQLFEMFGDEPLPVSLSQMCAMSPKMSRSGVFGLTRRSVDEK